MGIRDESLGRVFRDDGTSRKDIDVCLNQRRSANLDIRLK
jgi:hypothetical protein